MPAITYIRLSDAEKLAIAGQLLGTSLDETSLGNGVLTAWAQCPGITHHTGKDGHRDFQLMPNGSAFARCFHSSCEGEVAAFTQRWRDAIWEEEKHRTFGNQDGKPRKLTYKKKVPKAPLAPQKPTRSPIDIELLHRAIGNLRISRDWIKARSPIPVEGISQAEFLNQLFLPEDRILIFNNMKSQGQFIYQVPSPTRPGGLCRVSPQRNVKAVPCDDVWPKGGPEGIWFLCAPITGKWERSNTPGKDGTFGYTRRSEINVTRFPYIVLESDELPEDEWLALVAKMKLPVRAIYSSGGKSIHCMVYVNAKTSSHFAQIRRQMESSMTRLGACPGSLSILRLTRLPGCFRGDKGQWQELLYLDPAGSMAEKPLIDRLPERRLA